MLARRLKEEEDAEAAAIKIQASYRGTVSRRSVASMRAKARLAGGGGDVGGGGGARRGGDKDSGDRAGEGREAEGRRAQGQTLMGGGTRVAVRKKMKT